MESSSAMKLAQEKTLQPFAQENNWKLHWHNSVDDIPRCTETYTMILAHEFFDALPFHLLEVWSHPFIGSTSLTVNRKRTTVGKKF